MEWSNSLTWPAWLAIVAIVGLLLFAARRLALSDTARSAWLLALRVLAIALLLVLLANPVRVDELRQPDRLPSAMFLVDASRSMALEYPVSRLRQVQEFIRSSLSNVAATNQTRIQSFRFGSELLPLARADLAEADGDETQLRAALEDLPSRFGADLPKGIFLFSDGRGTRPENLQRVAKGYQHLGVPIHVIPVGDPRMAGDVAIRDLLVPRDAAGGGGKVPVKVVVGSHGCAGRRVELSIRPANDLQAVPLATLPVTLNDQDQTLELVVDVDRASARLVATIPTFDGEAIADNNQVAFQIGPRKSKIRVIYMEGTVNNEYRWVHDALVADANIECLSLVVDNQYVEQQRIYRVDGSGLGFPSTREELFSYDVVICSDIAWRSFTQEQLDWTVELVAKQGGGFAMVGGVTSFGAGLYDQTVWDQLIPVDMTGGVGQFGAGVLWNTPFQIAPTPEAETHPIWRIVDDPEQNREIIGRMPMFNGTNLTDRLKPGAVLLGVASPPIAGQGAMPILSCQSYGAGRTLALSTDTTADWGKDFERYWGEGDNRYFQKFWRNIVQWLAEGSAGLNRRLRVEPDKLLYHPGDTMQLVARAYDANLLPTHAYRLQAALHARAQDGSPAGSRGPLLAQIDLQPDDTSTDLRYAGALRAPTWAELQTTPAASSTSSTEATLVVSAQDGQQLVAEVPLEIQFVDDPPEFHDPRPDAEALAEVARVSGGRVLSNSNELAQLLSTYSSVPGERTIYRAPLWDRGLWWFGLFATLCAEWILRRAKGLA